MNRLQTQPKLTLSEYLWLLILALYSVSVFNLGGYVLVFMLGLYLLLHLRRISLSPLFLSLLFFSAFYFTFYYLHFDLGFSEIFNYLIAPWAALAFGEIFTRRSVCRWAPYMVIGVVAMGLFAHGLLNLFAYLENIATAIDGRRAAYDFWRQEWISVTANGLYYPMALGLALGVLFSDFRKWVKLLALAVIAVAGVNAVLLGHRTTLFVVLLILIYNVAVVLLRRDTSIREKRKWIVSGIVLLIILTIVYAADLAGFRTWIENSVLFARMTNSDSVNSTSRLAIWMSFFKNAYLHPFGGAAFDLAEQASWVHNLWFDVYYKVGILPFVCLCIATALIVKQLLALRRQCRNSGQTQVSAVLTNLYLAVFLSCMVEPVIDANPYLLISFFMITGCVSGILQKGQGDAQ